MKTHANTTRVYDSLDKIRAYYLEGATLSELQEKKRLQYEEAHCLRLAGYSKSQAVKILQRKGTVNNERDGYRVCNTAEMLFGDITASNKEGIRVILTDLLFRNHRKAIKNDNLRESNRAIENIAEINGLLSHEDSIKWSDLTLPIPVYTSDPKVLKN